MSIRLLEPADRAAWDPLWRGYLEFYEKELPVAVTEKTWTRFLDPGEPTRAIGLFSEEALIGFAHFLFHRSTWSDGPYCYLEDLYVIREQRGRGVGRELIEAVARLAQEAGATQLYWWTHATNHQAMALYDQVAARSGFLHYQRTLGLLK